MLRFEFLIIKANMRRILEITFLACSIIVLFSSVGFDNESRISIIYPISIGLVVLSNFCRINKANGFIPNIVLGVNSLGLIGAFFYFEHWPFGLELVFAWMICRLYVNYTIFFTSPDINFINKKIIFEIILILSLLQSIFVIRSYWLTSGMSSLILFLLIIFSSIVVFNRENKNWIKDYIFQIWSQNLYLLVWILIKISLFKRI